MNIAEPAGRAGAGPLHERGTETETTTDHQAPHPRGKSEFSSKWRMTAAVLLLLGGCAEQSTEPTGEISYEQLKEMALERLGPGFQSHLTYTRPEFSDPCIPPGGGGGLVDYRVGLADEAPAQRSGECQQRFTTWLSSKTPAKTLQSEAPMFSVLGGTCPVISHDIVASTIGDLRYAVATAAPGTVIGIDGQLDINSDYGGDVVVASDGITLTCASDGAGLIGLPTAGTGVLNVQANQVRVEWLDVTALPETGGPDLSRGVVVFGDDGVVSHNRLACERTCIFFVGASGGLAEYNEVTSGFKFFGIVASGGDNVTVNGNWIEDCLSCVRFSAHTDGLAQRNDVSSCLDTCIWFENSAGGLAKDNEVQFARLGITSGSSRDISVVGNTIADCFDACISSGTFFGPRPENFSVIGNQLASCGDLFTQSCMWLTELDGGQVDDNDIDGALNAAAVRLVSAADVVVNDNRAEGSLLALFSGGITLSDNTVSNCLFDCVTVSQSFEIEIRDNEITGDADEDFFGINAVQSPGVIAVDNKINGTFEATGISVDMGFEGGSATISDNKVEIVTADFGAGIRLMFVSNSQLRDNEIELINGGPNSQGISLTGTANKVTVKLNGVIVFQDESFQLVTGNLVADNTVSGANVGLNVDAACTNTFVDNDLAGNGTGALFTLVGRDEFGFETPEGDLIEVIADIGGTGANTLSGGTGTVVEATQDGLPVAGNGYLDCDTDGTGDPNIFGDGD